MLEKLQLSALLNTYSALLTDRQRAAIKMYCDCDCSLSEIAEELGISRQGVRDAIVKGEKSLVELEAALSLSEFTSTLVKALADDDVAAIKQAVSNFVIKE